VSSLSTSGHADAAHAGAYALKSLGAAYLAATINYARFDNKTERTIAGLGATETANGRFAGDQLGGRVEFGWRRPIDRFIVTPFVAVEPSVLWQQAYTEATTVSGGGSGVLGLSYASHTTTSLPTFLGAQLDTRYVYGEEVLSPFARLSWVHEFNPVRQIDAAFITLPTPEFTVDGARAARDALRIDTGATLALNGAAALFANFTGEWSDRSSLIAATAGAKIMW
jgi:outer membrane autotransporter protein